MAIGSPRGLAAVSRNPVRSGGLLSAPSSVPNVSPESTRILLTRQIPQVLWVGWHRVPLTILCMLLMLAPSVVLTLSRLRKCLVLTLM